jgi:hypothetical protein
MSSEEKDSSWTVVPEVNVTIHGNEILRTVECIDRHMRNQANRDVTGAQKKNMVVTFVSIEFSKWESTTIHEIVSFMYAVCPQRYRPRWRVRWSRRVKQVVNCILNFCA